LLFGYLTAVFGWSQPYIISTIAGTDRLLDGNAAINVPLRDPRVIKVDASGNLYIADTGGHRIRKISQSGTISTIAGNGLPGFGGDRGKATGAQLNSPSSLAFDGNGNLYVVATTDRQSMPRSAIRPALPLTYRATSISLTSPTIVFAKLRSRPEQSPPLRATVLSSSQETTAPR
jgi:hypothetical protein